MLIAIVTHTPGWVWALLAALLLLGLWQRRTRRVSPRSLLMLPLAMLVLGLASSGRGFVAQPLSAAAWAAAFAAGIALGLRVPAPCGTVWLARENRLRLAGSWWPLGVIVAIFSLRYAVSVAQALNPAWQTDVQLLAAVALLYGLLGGSFMGRALALRRMATSATTKATNSVAASARATAAPAALA